MEPVIVVRIHAPELHDQHFIEDDMEQDKKESFVDKLLKFLNVDGPRYYKDGRGDLRSRKRDVIKQVGEKYNVCTHGKNKKKIRRWLYEQAVSNG